MTWPEAQGSYHGILRRTVCQLLSYDVLKRFFIRTVYAEPAVAAEEGRVLTTLERLAGCRPQNLVSEKEVNDYIQKESGGQRVRELFSKRSNYEFSEDIEMIMRMSENCGILVFITTSAFGGNAAKERFLEKNKHKAFETRFLALRAYNDTVIFGSLRFGLKWGIKSAFFTGLFLMTAQVISVYRNKSSIWDYMAAGGVTCSLLRMSVGLKGMFAGAVIGSTLGLVGGLGLCGLMYSTNFTQEQRHFWAVEERLREKKEMERLQSKSSVETL